MRIEVLKEKISQNYPSQRDFAKAIGIDASTLCLILQGQRKCSLEIASNMKDSLGLTSKEADYIFFGNDGAN